MTLDAQLKTARAGDVIDLGTLDQGDCVVNAHNFSPAVTVKGGAFASLKITNTTGLHFEGAKVQYVPSALTASFSAAVKIEGCHDVGLNASTITGGLAVNGVEPTATVLDNTGNVKGFPCGYGVNITNSPGAFVTNCELSCFDRPIVLATDDCLIQRNSISNRRRTAIAGGGGRIEIDRNLIRGASPWRVGMTPTGDHVDFIALWSAAKQNTPNAGVKVTNNLMIEDTGAPSLGMWFQGGPPSTVAPAGAPFTDFTISGNFIGVGNNQGIALWQAQGGTISGNTLVQVLSVGMTPEQIVKQLPTILLLDGVSGVSSTGNALGVGMADRTGKSTASGNTFTKPSLDGGLSEIKVWLADHPDMAKIAAPLLPDPRDAQIVDLTSKLATAQATAQKAASDNAALLKRWADLTAGLKALVATAGP